MKNNNRITRICAYILIACILLSFAFSTFALARSCNNEAKADEVVNNNIYIGDKVLLPINMSEFGLVTFDSPYSTYDYFESTNSTGEEPYGLLPLNMWRIFSQICPANIWSNCGFPLSSFEGVNNSPNYQQVAWNLLSRSVLNSTYTTPLSCVFQTDCSTFCSYLNSIDYNNLDIVDKQNFKLNYGRYCLPYSFNWSKQIECDLYSQNDYSFLCSNVNTCTVNLPTINDLIIPSDYTTVPYNFACIYLFAIPDIWTDDNFDSYHFFSSTYRRVRRYYYCYAPLFYNLRIYDYSFNTDFSNSDDTSLLRVTISDFKNDLLGENTVTDLYSDRESNLQQNNLFKVNLVYANGFNLSIIFSNVNTYQSGSPGGLNTQSFDYTRGTYFNRSNNSWISYSDYISSQNVFDYYLGANRVPVFTPYFSTGAGYNASQVYTSYVYTVSIPASDDFARGYNTAQNYYEQNYNSIVQNMLSQYLSEYRNSIDYNSASYNAGVTAGINQGYENGYSVGRNDGITSANNYSFLGLIGAVVDAPIQAFKGLLNFNFLGVNLLAFVTGLLTVCLIIFVVKKLIGK